ncbi:MAG: hypothetical protein MK066_14115 [Crocinitomicaceae bacterium]|nr:hypothetical protein [Crocinitomicaceae bacterium]
MKKSILAVAVLLGTTTAFAQDLTSKKGESYLPEAGDWAVSIDATPLLGYVQGIFGSNGGSSTGSWSFLNGSNTITGKYFVADDMAYRGGINIGFGSVTENAYVADVVSSTPGALVTDSKKTSTSQIFLTGGIEWRKGSTRLQGFYGGELGLGFGGGSATTYTYGNDYDFTTNPTQTHGVDGATDVLATQQKGGIMFGLRGFVGAEYFVLPKIAIGGEFGWGLGFASTGEGTTDTKQVNSGGTALEDVTNQTVAKSSSFGIGTDNANSMFGPSGSLRLSFHF